MADPALYERAAELPAGSITIRELEEQNPVLWEAQVALDGLTPINHPHYRVLENGEAEYTGWISSRVLNTNVAVKLSSGEIRFSTKTGCRNPSLCP